MTWTLDVAMGDEPWGTVRECPSADRCKAWAKGWQRSLRGSVPLHLRIFDPLGRLVFQAYTCTEGRIRWKWGNFETRYQLALVDGVVDAEGLRGEEMMPGVRGKTELTEPLPCAFKRGRKREACGGTPEIWPAAFSGFYARCKDCGAATSIGSKPTLDSAIQEWNRWMRIEATL